MKSRAFTLIETMLAVLLIAMVASAAALTFSKPIAQARTQDAIDQLRSFDQSTRAAAVSAQQMTRIAFDLSNQTIERRDGESLKNVRFAVHLRSGCRITSVRIGDESTSVGEALVDVSPMGLSHTYAVHLTGASTDRWIVFAGMSGEMKQLADESAVERILDADAAK